MKTIENIESGDSQLDDSATMEFLSFTNENENV